MNFNLIKKDDLCWNESDQKYVPLSEDEIDKILESLYGDRKSTRLNSSHT